MEIGLDHFIQALLIKELDRIRIEGRCLALAALLQILLELLQLIQEYGGIADLPHGILIVVHPVWIALGVIRQEGPNGLDHVAELLEGDPHPVDSGRVRGI